MIVPANSNSRPSASPAAPQVDETFLMMAAAQMHMEGRLVQSQYGEPDTTQSQPPLDKKPPPKEYLPSSGDRSGPSMMT